MNNIFNFPDRSAAQSALIQKKHVEQTLIERYGSKDAFRFGSPEHLAIIRDKYGVDNVFQLDSVREKSRKTSLERYGNEHFTNPEKALQTSIARYGRRLNLFGSEEFLNSMQAKYGKCSFRKCAYSYNSTYFDSFPELCFFMYSIHAGDQIRREPVKLAYFFEGDTHYYVPDFEVNGKLFEIKGPHLVDMSGC